MSKPKTNIILGISSKGTCLLLLWHPAYRQRDLNTGIYMEFRMAGQAVRTCRRNGKRKLQAKTQQKGKYR